MNEKKLLKLKREIEDKKESVAELKGKKSAVLDTLKKNWNCTSLEEAQEKSVKLKFEVTDLKSKIESGIKKLQKQYNL